MVPVKKLRHDGGTQSRKKRDDAVIAEYAEAMATPAGVEAFPPLRVVYDKKNRSHWVWDGHHRKLAAAAAGVVEFQCLVREATQEEAVWLATSANKDHGLRRTTEDKQKAVRDALRARPKMSDRVIAEHVGVDYKTVAKHREEMEGGGEIPRLTVRQGADGREYDTAQTSAPSKARGEKAQAAATAGTLTPDAAPAHKPRVVREGAQDEAPEDVPSIEQFERDNDGDDLDGGDLVEDGAMAEQPYDGLVDNEGTPVPGDLEAVWQLLSDGATEVDRALNLAAHAWSRLQDQLLRQVRKVGTDAHLPSKFMPSVDNEFGPSGRIHSMQSLLRRMVPHVLCGNCEGMGCARCDNLGWFSRIDWKERQRVDGVLEDAGVEE